MNIEATKLELVQHLLNTEKESVLAKIKEIFTQEQNNDKIVAYTVDGKPLTKSEYVLEIKNAEKRIAEGKYTSHQEVLKKVQNW